MSVAKLEATLDLNGKGFKNGIEGAKKEAKGFDNTIRNTGREVENLNKVPWFQQGKKNVTDFRSTIEMVKMAFRTGWEMGEGLDKIIKFFTGESLTDRLGKMMTYVADAGNRIGESLRNQRREQEAINNELAKHVAYVDQLQTKQDELATKRVDERQSSDIAQATLEDRLARAQESQKTGNVPLPSEIEKQSVVRQAQSASERIDYNEANIAQTKSLMSQNQIAMDGLMGSKARVAAEKLQKDLEWKLAGYIDAIEKDKKAINAHGLMLEVLTEEDKARAAIADSYRIWAENEATSQAQAAIVDQREALEAKIKPVSVGAFADMSSMGAYRGESVAKQIDMAKSQIDALRANTKALEEFNKNNPVEY